MLKVLHQGKDISKIERIEFGDIIVMGDEHFIVGQVNEGYMLFTFESDILNRVTNKVYAERSNLTIPILQTYLKGSSYNTENMKLIKKKDYQLSILY